MSKMTLIVAVVALWLGAVLAVLPLAAEDCYMKDGTPRECSASERWNQCLLNAIDAAEQKADKGSDNIFIRFVEFNIDVAHCTVKLLNPFN